eukprot:CAMPEP_0172872544 /NCGR_PEP_ID=MMETSP1075-20121228/92691_1 /TAXON_ID=2916 /ORGANISM="Ceratium fusus, Strain PA161109" /LENGTH=49 /DNA_ID=CAMNT_0013722877 /DNA_START=493 /DNA_END=642 /DNA_ORIENTATION=+
MGLLWAILGEWMGADAHGRAVEETATWFSCPTKFMPGGGLLLLAWATPL